MNGCKGNVLIIICIFFFFVWYCCIYHILFLLIVAHCKEYRLSIFLAPWNGFE